MRYVIRLVVVMFTFVLIVGVAALAVSAFSGSGGGTPANPYIITTVEELQSMKDNLTAHYALGNDINASDTRTWNENLENENEYFGFEPIGTAASRFTGSFDGCGYKIINLYINRSGTDNVGLFGYVGDGGVVENVGLENANARGQNRVGGLVGRNAGTVSNCCSTGSVSGGDWYVGGLVGGNTGTVSNCYSTGTASCKVSCVGGLVGRNDGTVSNCYSTSSVSGGGGWYAAGLVGYNYGGTVSNCYSTGSVSGTNGIGGLVGNNTGTVSNCYSTSSVSGGDWYVGGLVGCGSGTVSNCYSTGSVSGSLSSVGGLVGGNLGGTVSNCYSTGTVSGGVQDVGGIAGGNYWGGIVSNCYSTGSVSCNGYVGGLVGWNDGTVSGCYSTGGVSDGYAVGGLVGANVGTVSNSFYDENTSGQSDTGKGEPKTTAEMKNVRTYTDNTWSVGLTTPWDFVGNPYEDENNENLWDIGSAVNNGYPYLIKVTGLNGSGTSGDPYVIKTVGQLQVMKDNLSAYYILGNDIDASATHTWNDNGDGGYYGFEPIGTGVNRFTGSFDGRGYKIYNLYINRPTTDYVGLFGYVEDVGAVENVGVENENISGDSYVGGLIGRNNGTVSNSYSTGTVSGKNDVSERIGGLVGQNEGTVSNSYSTASVSGAGGDEVGGLVGRNNGTVSNSYSTGTVSGNQDVGGLVGINRGTVTNCHSTGSVNGGDWYVGGLVGRNDGTVTNSYSTSSVINSGNPTGGLFGSNYGTGGLVGRNNGTVSNCHSTGSVSGYREVGGLVGINGGTVDNSYSTGTVSGYQDVGGLVGGNYGGKVSNCYSTGSVSGVNWYVGGLIGYNTVIVTNCYSTGSVSCNGYVGGLVGYNEGTVSGCYSTGGVSGGYAAGGLVGANVGTVSNSFYDENTSGQSDTGKGEPKTTENMKYVRTFTDNTWSVGLTTPWDFVGNPYEDENNEDIWNIVSHKNRGYPFLTSLGAENTFSSGSGISEDPFIITNVYQLQNMKYYLNLDVYFALGNDIDASATIGWENGFLPVGTGANNNFTGSLDGRGHKIINLYINRSGTDNVGLFGFVGSGGVVENVGLENENVSGKSYVGGLVGRDDYGTVSNCYSTGLVSGSINYVGGLVGFNNYGTVSNSYATGSVSGNDGIGGLVGVNNNAATVSNSYSTGTVSGNLNSGGLVGQSSGIVSDCYSTGSVSGGSYVGGLVGQNYKKIVSNSYSTGSVSGSSYVGGLAGRNGGTVSNCYSTGSVSGSSYVGGLVGYRQSGTTVSNSFWDNDTSGQSTSAGGKGKTTENMKNVQTFTDNAWSENLTTPWDFVGNPYGDTGDENIWHIHPAVNDGYPFLVALMDFPPGLPVLYLPENGTSTDGNTPTFEWTAGANAENHRLLVGNDPGFTSPEIDVMLGPDDNTYTAPDENALPDNLYYWKVVAIRGAYENESDVWSFTVDTVPPVISNVTASSITTSSATITWTTDEPSDSIVEYGTTIAYGLTSSDATLVTSHSRSLTGLSAGTTYHYRVKSTDNAGNPAVSSDYTFTTSSPLPPPVPDFSMSVSPTSGSVVQGGSANATVSVSSIAGFTSTVSLSASGLPSGATASFSSSSGTPSFNSTLTIPTSSTTPTGIYTITVTGAGAGTTHACTYTLTVSPRVVQETPPENIPRIEPGVPQTITVENMGITDLTINVGESVENVQISIQQLTDKPATIQIAAPGVVYQTFSIIVENLPEDKIENVVIHFKVEKSWIAENLIVISTIVLNRYDPVNAQWVSLPTTYLGEDDTYVYFSAVSPGLSVLAITGEIKILAPAAFSVSGLTTSPEHVGIGETVSISVMVKNTGDLAGTCVVTLKIGGTVEAIQNVTINGGSERLVTFTVTRGAVGIYSVDVDGLTGSFSVVAPPTVVPLSASVIFLIAVVVIGGLLGGIAVYSRYFGRRRMQRARRGRGSRIGRD